MIKVDDHANPDVAKNLVFYESARDEMISRIALRDQSLIAYIATSGAYFGFVVEGRKDAEEAVASIAMESAIVLVLPILSLVFTYVILQHHIMIGKLGEYTRQVFPTGNHHWDHTYATWEDKRYLSARTISQALLLIMPVAYTAIFAVRAFPIIETLTDKIAVYSVLMFDVVVFAMIVRLQVWAYALRKKTDYVRTA